MKIAAHADLYTKPRWDTHMDIAFVGLGAMGKGMAINLVKAGHSVRVWNRSRGPADEVARQGARRLESPREAAAGDAVLLMLADDAAVRAVITEAALLENAPRGFAVVNLSTVSVALAQELTERCQRHGITYVAAPVFGRPDVAAAGKLQIVVAGDPTVVARLQPLFDAMGQRTWSVGAEPYGANVVKLAGNFMIAAAIASMGQAIALGEANGVHASDLMEVLTNAVFNTPVYKNYGTLIADRRYEPPGFRLTLGLKDVRLALAAGESAHVPLPFASALRDDFLDAVAHGDSDLDWGAVAEVARRRAGLENSVVTGD
jgi:3-hydroxyisobutyrate dehydrogenase-like beta-hydroxyacid dehydrogenase